MKNISKLIVSAIVSLLGLAGCQDNGGPRNHEIMYSDIVSVESASDADGTTFTMQRYDDSPLITYTASNWVAPEKYVGQRVQIYYYTQTGQPYAPGPIRLRGVNSINNGDVNTDGDPFEPAWDADAVWLNAIWRTGKYLNLRLRVSYSSEPRYFSLVADAATLSDEQPQLYLVHNLNGQPGSYLSEIYSSFDISAVWNQPSCRSVCVHINDLNRPQQTYVFEKHD